MYYIIIKSYTNKPYIYFRGTYQECASKIEDLDNRSASRGWKSMKGNGTFSFTTYYKCERGQVRDYNSITAYMSDDVNDILVYFQIRA